MLDDDDGDDNDEVQILWLFYVQLFFMSHFFPADCELLMKWSEGSRYASSSPFKDHQRSCKFLFFLDVFLFFFATQAGKNSILINLGLVAVMNTKGEERRSFHHIHTHTHTTFNGNFALATIARYYIIEGDEIHINLRAYITSHITWGDVKVQSIKASDVRAFGFDESHSWW